MQLNFSECRSKRDTPYLFPQTKGILNALKDGGIDIAIASKSPTPDIATTYLDKLSIRSMFVAEVRYLLNLINLQLKYLHLHGVYCCNQISFHVRGQI